MSKVKVFGERNTGTNYLEQLIELNLKQVEVIPQISIPAWFPNLLLRRIELLTDYFLWSGSKYRLGWKHGIPPTKKILQHPDRDKLLTIFLVRNPYSFLLSLHKNPYHLRPRVETFSEFLETRFKTLPRDGYSSQPRITPIDIWNLKNRAYLEFSQEHPDKTLLIHFEDLLEKPERVIHQIAQRMKVSFNPGFQNIERSTKNTSDRYADYKAYYGQELWKKKLSTEDKQFITEHLDLKLMESLGYKKP